MEKQLRRPGSPTYFDVYRSGTGGSLYGVRAILFLSSIDPAHNVAICDVTPQLCQRKKVFFLNFHVTTTSTKVIECTGYGGKKSTNKKIPQEVPKYAHVCIVVKFHKIFMIPQPVTPE